MQTGRDDAEGKEVKLLSAAVIREGVLEMGVRIGKAAQNQAMDAVCGAFPLYWRGQ